MTSNAMENRELGATTIVIFGASGDLTRRKLLPSLYNLYLKNRLPKKYLIVGFAKSEYSVDEFKSVIQEGAKNLAEIDVESKEWQEFLKNLRYIPGDFMKEEDFKTLASGLESEETETANRLYYLATPPRFFENIVQQLGSQDMVDGGEKWRRVVIEKPFGNGFPSARALNQSIHTILSEDQIYRIDHFLGKETVQNILVFRFANAIFEPIWNRNFVDNVQISVLEKIGIGHRGGYYDQAGILRDMFQNHLLQLLALTAIEPPAEFEADSLRNEKVKILKSVRPIRSSDVNEYTVRGQYRGYQNEPEIAPNSNTATYAALRLHVDNWRWHGVPFFLRSGKKLAEKSTEIVINFKKPPHMMFPLPEEYEITSNVLGICIQPDEGVHLRFEAKVPDEAAVMRSVDMDFHYKESFGECEIPDAYERLLLDALQGDQSLFTRSDAIELSWKLIDPIITGWHSQNTPALAIYEPNSRGPVEADQFIEQNAIKWSHPCGQHS